MSVPAAVDEAAELAAAAELVAERFPRAAARLLAMAKPVERPEPRELRRLVLRRLWRTHLEGMARTAAARVLAARWAAWQPGDGEDLPGTMGAAFARLDRAGMRACRWRQIADDLDDDL